MSSDVNSRFTIPAFAFRSRFRIQCVFPLPSYCYLNMHLISLLFLPRFQDMKLQNSLWNKYGESLEERSLTICSGTDYINVNYQHIVCPDAETAKVRVFNACLHV